MKLRLSIASLAGVVAALALTMPAGAANRPGDYTVKPAASGWSAVHPDPTSIRSHIGAFRPNPCIGRLGNADAF